LTEWSGFVQSLEAEVIEAQDQKERRKLRRFLLEGLDNYLTPVQRRRLWLYCVEGLTVRQIAQAEGAAHQNVVKSIKAAKKKIKKFLLGQGAKTPF
jgi:DNA-directed RNA polymerase specialized sigma24 family protein